MAAVVSVGGVEDCISVMQKIEEVASVVSNTNNKCSAVTEMGDRLAAIDIGRKLGVCPFVWGAGTYVTQCGLSRGLPSYLVAS